MILFLDFETFFSTEYSLKKLHTLEYVRHEQFKVHGAAVSLDYSETTWIPATELEEFFESLDWADITLVCHNTYFDGLILFDRYGKIPARYCCTLSLARALFPFTSHSLDNIGKVLSVGGKIQGTLDEIKGVRQLSPEQDKKVGEYACRDVDVMIGVYDKMIMAFPEDEQELLDLTLRWGCVPTLCIDAPRAEAALEHITEQREEIIRASGLSEKVLASNPQFAAHLFSLNITPPTKLSPATGKETYAFAKNDFAFIDVMADHPEHKDLWDARLAVKSTLLHTRISRLLGISRRGAGTLPMPLKYCGAHTLRWSGQDGLNPQNFTRKSELRKSIIAPPGYRIVVADLSQIELRLNFWFCGQEDRLDVFRQGKDIYTDTASRHYDIPYDEVTDDQRFFGKTLDLGLGYGMGALKFRRTCALKDIFMSPQEAVQVVNAYRYEHGNVKQMWSTLNRMIYHMYHGNHQRIRCVEFTKDSVVLPNGMSLSYHALTPHENSRWTYGHPKVKNLYGALLLENIIQALARVVLGEMILKIHRQYPEIHIASTTHDEIIALSREEDADTALAAMLEVMAQSPDWAPDLPLAGEGAHERYYCK